MAPAGPPATPTPRVTRAVSAMVDGVVRAPRPSRRRSHPNLMPPNFQAPAGLFLRLLRTRNRAAYFAIEHTALAILAPPLALLLERAERRLYARADPPRK